jgi:hypothetical protein
VFQRRGDDIKMDLQEIGRKVWTELIGLGTEKSYRFL